MVVAVRELDLQLDPREERGGRMEDEAVRARREIVREMPSSSTPVTSADGKSRSVADIYRRAGAGVVFVTARVVTQSDSPFGLPLKQEGLATGSGFVLDKNGKVVYSELVKEVADEPNDDAALKAVECTL